MYESQPPYLTSNTNTLYPFASELLTPQTIYSLFVDFYCEHTSDINSPLYISQFAIDPTLNTASLIIRLADSSIFFNSADADDFKYNIYSSRWIVLEWVASGTVVKLILDAEAVSNFTYPVLITNGQIIASLVHKKAEVLTSINSQDGAIRLIAGNGFSITQNENNIQLNLVNAEDTIQQLRLVKTISRVEPVNGDVQIKARGCSRYEIPGVIAGDEYIPDDHTIKIVDTCGPCCECDDYVRVYKALRNIWSQFVEVAEHFEENRVKYHELRTLWLGEKAARETGPYLLLRAFSRPKYNVGIVVTLMNMQATAIQPNINFNFAFSAFSQTFVPGSGWLSYDDSLVASNSINATWTEGEIRGTRWLRYSFDIYINGEDRDNQPMTITATATAPGVSLSANRTVTILPPVDLETS